jgi:hypothetical protein
MILFLSKKKFHFLFCKRVYAFGELAACHHSCSVLYLLCTTVAIATEPAVNNLCPIQSTIQPALGVVPPQLYGP